MNADELDTFHGAVREDDRSTAERMLAANPALLDAPGSEYEKWLPIDRCAKHDCAEVAKLLIERGANLEHAHGSSMWTPLHIAAENGSLGVAKLLIDAGVDVNVRDTEFGWTPIYRAADHGHVEIAEALLKAGALMTEDDGLRGWSPLHFACINGDLAMAKLLVNAGAKIDQLDDDRQPAIHWARDEGHTEVVAYLEGRAQK